MDFYKETGQALISVVVIIVDLAFLFRIWLSRTAVTGPLS
jgi:predicted negative regulator of RcsB-dependent stress response